MKEFINRKCRAVVAVAFVCVLLASLMTGCSSKKANTVVVGSKSFTESMLLGEIMAQLIEDRTDIKVERNLGLASGICFEALKKGDLDIYAEYTGTAVIDYLKLEPVKTREETYEIAKRECEERFGLIFMADWGFSNTYANAVTREFSETNGVTTNSQLAAFTPDLVYGAGHTFYDREDGYDNMCEVYGYNFKDQYKCDTGLVYQAFAQGEMDVASVFSTDGMLSEYDLVVLEDDQNFFPHYDCASLTRQDVLDAHPELEDVLNSFSKIATEKDMSRYNYLVDSKKMSLEDAATEFLKEKGLI